MLNMEKFLELKISVATLVAWIVAVIFSVGGASAVYGRLEQRVANTEKVSERIERQLDRIESTALNLTTTVTRIEAEARLEWKGRVSPSNGDK